MFSEIHCVVMGRVQGVGYRDFVEGKAREFGIFGWIKNKPNGSVEMVFQGTPDMLKTCIEFINQGSLLAQVESVAIDWQTPRKHFEEFKVIAS